MIRALVVYTLLVSVARLIFGVLRILLLVPVTGPLIGLMAELPATFGVSLFLARWLLKAHWRSTSPAAQIRSGVLVLGLLQGVSMLSALVLGQPLPAYLEWLTSPAGLVGILSNALSGAAVAIVGRGGEARTRHIVAG